MSTEEEVLRNSRELLFPTNPHWGLSNSQVKEENIYFLRSHMLWRIGMLTFTLWHTYLKLWTHNEKNLWYSPQAHLISTDNYFKLHTKLWNCNVRKYIYTLSSHSITTKYIHSNWVGQESQPMTVPTQQALVVTW